MTDQDAWDLALMSKDEIRAKLSLEWVVQRELDVSLDDDGNAQCPFHEDARPSFSIFISDDEVERAGCWSCDWRGDLFDVLMVNGRTFGTALDVARDFLARYPDQAVIRVKRERPTVPPEVLQQEVGDAFTRHAQGTFGPVDRLLVRRGLRMSPVYLLERWGVGIASEVGVGSVLIPHYGPPPERYLTGYKVRTGGGPTIARSGSRFPYLYGEFHWTDEARPVILTEGESDAWTIDWLFPDDYHVLALPTGANSAIRSEWLTLLRGAEVILAFDGDEAGVKATGRWTTALTGAAHVWTLDFTAKQDCSNVMPTELRRLLDGN